MQQMLAAARCRSAVVQVIAGVVDACRECRAWASNASKIAPSVEPVTPPDHYVEGDLLFYRQCPIWCMIDGADRWHAADLLEGDSSDAGRRSSESSFHAMLAC
eukprot:575578-Pyramimonas_sp.AAC.1